MNLSKEDLLKLLTMLEGELQAKEIFITILKNEQVKQLLNPCLFRKKLPFSKSGNDTLMSKSIISNSEPYSALFRDTYSALDPTFDSNSIELAFNLQEKQLNSLITKQRIVRKFLESQIIEMHDRYEACFSELEIERRKNIEFERDKILKKIFVVNREKVNLLQEIGMLKVDFEKEKEREKQMIVCLLGERKQLIVELIEEKQKNSELNRLLAIEKILNAEMVEGVEEEFKRSLQMEADLERVMAELEKQKQVFKEANLSNEAKLSQLKTENDKLRQDLESIKLKRIASLGEGVKSSEAKHSQLKTENDKLRQDLESIKLKRIASLGEGVRSTVNSGEHKIDANVTQPEATSSDVKDSLASSVAPNRSLVSSKQQSLSLKSYTPTTTYATVKPLHKSFASISLNDTSTPYSSSNPTLPIQPSSSSSSTFSTSSSPSSSNVAPNRDTSSAPSKTHCVPVASSVAKFSSSGTTGKVISPSSINQNVSPVTRKVSSPVTSSNTGTSPVHPRGAPPPIPPNKPILTPNALKEKSKELQNVRAAKLLAAKSTSPSPTTTVTSATNVLATTTLTSQTAKFNHKQPAALKPALNGGKAEQASTLVKNNINNVDMICQELADFQQLLVSMESNKTSFN